MNIYFAQSGNSDNSIPKINWPINIMEREIIIIPEILSHIPVCAMSLISIRLVPKMRAFGGVATGIIKANEQAIVAGIIKNNGFTFSCTAIAANMGRKICADPVFEVSSVRKTNMVIIIITKITGLTASSPANCFPTQ